jgi:hypothetical protein
VHGAPSVKQAQQLLLWKSTALLLLLAALQIPSCMPSLSNEKQK